MDASFDRSLVICDGGVASLVACLLGDDPDDVVAWVPPLGAMLGEIPLEEPQRAAAIAQAELLCLGELIIEEDPHPAFSSLPLAGRSGVSSGMRLSMQLMAVLEEASRLRCLQVIWPTALGSDLDALFAVAERASLLSRLAEVDLGTTPEACTPVLETPLADLDELHIAEMAIDLDAPIQTCWWRRPDAIHSPSHATVARRWEDAIRVAQRIRGSARVRA